MQPKHIALAVLLSVFWGLNFVVITIGLSGFPPLLLAALRYVVAAVPVLFLPRPPIAFGKLALISIVLFVGQSALIYPSMAVGMPAGLASIGLQVQAFITIGLAAIVLRERPSGRQIAGAAIAFAGLALVAMTVGTNGVTLAGFALLMGAATSWAAGNVLLRGVGRVNMPALVSWLSLIAAPALLLLSLVVEGPTRIAAAASDVTWMTGGAILYMALVSTTFGYAVWGFLLERYPAATAAPFSLLVPVSGTLSAALILGETFGPLRLAGMILILAGLAVLVLGPRGTKLPIPADAG